ncbi:MAG TPA: hypothetical protein VL651_15670 [Bacteroidia bacterium]|nr:hypothetical protein [Bacteroidia bacterium]
MLKLIFRLFLSTFIFALAGFLTGYVSSGFLIFILPGLGFILPLLLSEKFIFHRGSLSLLIFLISPLAYLIAILTHTLTTKFSGMGNTDDWTAFSLASLTGGSLLFFFLLRDHPSSLKYVIFPLISFLGGLAFPMSVFLHLYGHPYELFNEQTMTGIAFALWFAWMGFWIFYLRLMIRRDKDAAWHI